MTAATDYLRQKIAPKINWQTIFLGGVVALTLYMVLVPLVYLLWNSFHTAASPLEKAPLGLKNYAEAYLDPATVIEKIPTLRMIAAKKEAVAARARRLGRRLSDLPVRISTLSSVSRVGGGSLPLEELPTMLLALEPEKISANDLEGRLRLHDPPIVARIVDDRLCLDLRTVMSRELGELESAIRNSLDETENR